MSALYLFGVLLSFVVIGGFTLVLVWAMGDFLSGANPTLVEYGDEMEADTRSFDSSKVFDNDEE